MFDKLWVFKIFKNKLSTFHKGLRKKSAPFLFAFCYKAEHNGWVAQLSRFNTYFGFKCSIFIGFGCIPVLDNLFISDEVWFFLFILTVLFLIKQVIQSTCVLCTRMLVEMEKKKIPKIFDKAFMFAMAWFWRMSLWFVLCRFFSPLAARAKKKHMAKIIIIMNLSREYKIKCGGRKLISNYSYRSKKEWAIRWKRTRLGFDLPRADEFCQHAISCSENKFKPKFNRNIAKSN